MAKSTSTTKAKSKTTKKKPATKRAVKSAKTTSTKSKKTTVKKSSAKTAKPAIKAPVAKTVVAKSGNKLEFLSRTQTRLGALFGLLAIAAGFLMNTTSAQVLLGHLTKDELASQAGTVLAPAAHVLHDAEFRWLLVALLSISAVIAVLRGTKYYAREQAGIKARISSARWIDFAITGALSFHIVALLNGLQDAVALKFAAVSIILAAFLAWVFERENAATKKPARAVYIASAVAITVPIVLLVATMYSTYVYGLVRSPWYAYVAAIVVSVGLLVTVRGVWKATKQQLTYAATDKKYNLVSAGTKVALAAVLIAGLYQA